MSLLQAGVFVAGFAVIVGGWCWAECRSIRKHGEEITRIYDEHSEVGE